MGYIVVEKQGVMNYARTSIDTLDNLLYFNRFPIYNLATMLKCTGIIHYTPLPLHMRAS